MRQIDKETTEPKWDFSNVGPVSSDGNLAVISIRGTAVCPDGYKWSNPDETRMATDKENPQYFYVGTGDGKCHKNGSD